ncbi:Protein of uncharacterised function (DUF3761) [Yersinia thracica]|uniref:Protein of uncharacterized function (DUF3761) n=1 Tax=Yersinia thracica TaxID=2890319 RepID=A0A0T9NGA8_9GAMM|nr:DUF3761 domain-containing protein [Yersinia thracica]CNH06807.1 Protein of uncharacterised function (DUF3761) [Yersinia thracica]
MSIKNILSIFGVTLFLLITLSSALIVNWANAAPTKATTAVVSAPAANSIQDTGDIKPTIKPPRKSRINANETTISESPAVKTTASPRKLHSSVLSPETTPAIPEPVTVKQKAPLSSVPRVTAAPAAGNIPSGATARCQDGTYSYSQQHSGACSRHKGVDRWLQ